MRNEALRPSAFPESAPPLPAGGAGRVTQTRLPNGGSIVCIAIVNGPIAQQRLLAAEAREVLSAMQKPFAVIVDMRRLTDYPPSHRQIYAEVREQLRATYERLHRLTVYVVESDAQRGFVIAVGWKAKASRASGRVFTDDWARACALCEEALTDPADG
jgi:hypothetical protein